MPLMRRFMLAATIVSQLGALDAVLSAQATSPWKRLDTQGTAVVPAVGASYVTVMFLTASVYQQAGWWTALIERNRKANLNLEASAIYQTARLSDTRFSNPVDIRRNKSQVSFGYQGALVARLPTTFQKLTIDVAVSKTSDDGVDKMVSTVAALSASTPALGISQAAVGITTAAKQVADLLFSKNLLENKLHSQFDMLPSGTAVPAGVYVALAGDQDSDWQKYFVAPASGTGLNWDGALLTWNSQPLNGISYFVVEVSYQSRVFATPLDALSLTPAIKPWVGLYQLASRKVGSIRQVSETDKIVAEISSSMTDARTLLDADPDYIQQERDAVHEAVRVQVEAALNAQVGRLAAAGGTTNGHPNAHPIVLALPDNTNDRVLLRGLIEAATTKGRMVIPPL